MTPLGLFKGEHALVTGSASNIGRAIALALAREGAAVRCADIDPARNATVVAEIVAAGGEAEAVTVDLATADGWHAALPPESKPVTLFVHSASPARREADTPLTVSEATWDAMVNTNVRSGFFIARELGRRMQAIARAAASRAACCSSPRCTPRRRATSPTTRPPRPGRPWW